MPFFHDLKPHPFLQPYVRLYRFLHLQFSESEIPPHKPYPPRPEVTLSFYPRDLERVVYKNNSDILPVRSALIGQQNIVTDRYVGKDFVLIQVVFQPGGLYRIMGFPVFEINNLYFDAETVFGNQLNQVNERLMNTANFSEMIPIVESFLCALVQKSKYQLRPIDRMNILLIDRINQFSIESMAEASCLSIKQFERNFCERAGVNPKYFVRITRFDKAFRLKNAYPKKDWLSIALEAGYYDYQHLVRDYKEFTGMSPLAFYLQDRQSPERIFGIKET